MLVKDWNQRWKSKLILSEQNDRHFAEDIFKCFFMNEKLWILIQINWSLFLRVQLTISQCSLRKWLDGEQATRYYLNECWPSSLTHMCDARGKWVYQNATACVIDRNQKFPFRGNRNPYNFIWHRKYVPNRNFPNICPKQKLIFFGQQYTYLKSLHNLTV